MGKTIEPLPDGMECTCLQSKIILHHYYLSTIYTCKISSTESESHIPEKCAKVYDFPLKIIFPLLGQNRDQGMG